MYTMYTYKEQEMSLDYIPPVASFRIRPNLKERITQLSKITKRSASFFYNKVLEENIDELENMYLPDPKIRKRVKKSNRIYFDEEIEKNSEE